MAMSPAAVPYRMRDGGGPADNRMLFVRTRGTFETMARAPLVVAGVIIAVAAMLAHPSFGSARDLDLVIYPDGSAHVSAEIDVDPLDADYELELFGSAVSNFVAVGEDGFLLQAEVGGGAAVVETFGSSVLAVQYDTHDLVSKAGRIWTFSLDSPADFTLLLPRNSVIVGMTDLPISMEAVDGQNRLTMPAGSTDIDYLFSSAAADPGAGDPAEPAGREADRYAAYGVIGAAAAAAAAAAAGTLVFLRRQRPGRPGAGAAPGPGPVDAEEILEANQDMREDDKAIVKFISDNGGKALERELRKKFLQPRTTMWRAVKRLERRGIVEIDKQDMQNLVRLRRGAGGAGGAEG